MRILQAPTLRLTFNHVKDEHRTEILINGEVVAYVREAVGGDGKPFGLWNTVPNARLWVQPLASIPRFDRFEDARTEAIGYVQECVAKLKFAHKLNEEDQRTRQSPEYLKKLEAIALDAEQIILDLRERTQSCGFDRAAVRLEQHFKALAKQVERERRG